MLLAATLVTAVLAQAGVPAATTGTVGSITPGGAVVAGTVDPNGSATTYQVEYGTSTSYGLQTTAVDAGSGDDPVEVRVALSGLTASTTYHVRLVATNAAGTDRGADRSFRTTASAQAPSASSAAPRSVAADAATLVGTVSPRGLATSVAFEYGTTSAYGSTTPVQSAGAGTTTRTLTARVTGLRPATRYWFRTVATSAAGTSRSAGRTFTTSRAPTSVTLTPSTSRPVWGSGLTVTGRVSGAPTTPVALQRQDAAGAWQQLATATPSSSGAFRMTVPPLYDRTLLRVVTRGAVVVASPVRAIRVAVKVGLRTVGVGGGRVRLTGATWPAVPAGRVSLQRRTLAGGWTLVRRVAPRPLAGGRSRYVVTVRRSARRALTYRVVVVARDGGAHVPGTSREVTLRPRR
jgi:hypothetical protein